MFLVMLVQINLLCCQSYKTAYKIMYGTQYLKIIINDFWVWRGVKYCSLNILFFRVFINRVTYYQRKVVTHPKEAAIPQREMAGCSLSLSKMGLSLSRQQGLEMHRTHTAADGLLCSPPC